MIYRFLLILLALPASLFAQDELTLLDGSRLPGTIQGIHRDRGVTLLGETEARPFDDLRAIQFGADPRALATDGMLVQLQGEGRIPVRDLTLANEELSLDWGMDDPLKLALEQVRAIRFQPGTENEAFDKALAEGGNDDDLFFIKVEGEVQAIKGLLEGISEQALAIDWDGRKRSLKFNQLYGVVLADLGAPPAGRYMIRLTNGALLPGNSIHLHGSGFTLGLDEDVELKLSNKLIRHIQIRSERIRFLSELKVAAEKNDPLLAPRRAMLRNQSIEGNPLTLDGRRFSSGLGVASGTELTFDVPAGFTHLSATIGVDDETNGHGDCEFVVRSGDRELYRKRMQGGVAPEAFSIPLGDAKKVKLTVEHGEDLDLADHANWADAAFIVEK